MQMCRLQICLQPTLQQPREPTTKKYIRTTFIPNNMDWVRVPISVQLLRRFLEFDQS